MHDALACEHPTTAKQSMQAPCSEGHRHPAGCPCSTGRSGSCRDAAAYADTADSMGAGARGGGHASPAGASRSCAVRSGREGSLAGGLTPYLTLSTIHVWKAEH